MLAQTQGQITIPLLLRCDMDATSSSIVLFPFPAAVGFVLSPSGHHSSKVPRACTPNRAMGQLLQSPSAHPSSSCGFRQHRRAHSGRALRPEQPQLLTGGSLDHPTNSSNRIVQTHLDATGAARHARRPTTGDTTRIAVYESPFPFWSGHPWPRDSTANRPASHLPAKGSQTIKNAKAESSFEQANWGPFVAGVAATASRRLPQHARGVPFSKHPRDGLACTYLRAQRFT